MWTLGLLLACKPADDTKIPPATTDETDADTDTDTDTDTDADADSGSSATTGDTAVTETTSPIEGEWIGTCVPGAVVFYGFTHLDLVLRLTESVGIVNGTGSLLASSYGSTTTQPPLAVSGTWDGVTLALPNWGFDYGATVSPLAVDFVGALVLDQPDQLDGTFTWFPDGTYGYPSIPYPCELTRN